MISPWVGLVAPTAAAGVPAAATAGVRRAATAGGGNAAGAALHRRRLVHVLAVDLGHVVGVAAQRLLELQVGLLGALLAAVVLSLPGGGRGLALGVLAQLRLGLGEPESYVGSVGAPGWAPSERCSSSAFLIAWPDFIRISPPCWSSADLAAIALPDLANASLVATPVWPPIASRVRRR